MTRRVIESAASPGMGGEALVMWRRVHAREEWSGRGESRGAHVVCPGEGAGRGGRPRAMCTPEARPG